jgi:large subunit ribosomal protein L25
LSARHIDVDVSNLALFESLRVKDLPHTGSIKFLNAEDATVAHVVSIREEVVPVAEVDAAAAAAAAAPTTAEPEVAKKGKPEAEGGAKKADSGAGAKK